jgi:AMMECR1 domain-containing protein
MYGKLARQVVEYWVKNSEEMPLPAVLVPELHRQRACYVSIFENPGRRFRSMAGNILPRHANLAEEIIGNTMDAIIYNPRCRLSRVDLPHLSYSVALLGPLQRISDLQHLDPQRYGLYVVSDRSKSSIVLPQRVGIDTADDQVATAMREAGIGTREETVTMYRFDVEFHDG